MSNLDEFCLEEEPEDRIDVIDLDDKSGNVHQWI